MDGQSEKPLVLIVEDETDIRNMINMLVKSAGFESIAVATGEEGLEAARTYKPMVMTLDRMLPGIDGIEVCRQLRADDDIADTYVIMVTALGEVEDRIDGLEIGADDYISKPFQNKELTLRIKAAVRRLQQSSKPSGLSERQYGILRIDNDKHRVWIDGEEVNMTITEYKLLLHLLKSIDKLCSRGELLEEVWELPPTLNTRTVDTHIKRLRQKMGKAADYIQTVRGAGYRFSVAD
ncbi:MAG: response regulator transcription factor [Myxococcota bacterium]|nr:response regulator transcription factor [Myxococcota bacterium]